MGRLLLQFFWLHRGQVPDTFLWFVDNEPLKDPTSRFGDEEYDEEYNSESDESDDENNAETLKMEDHDQIKTAPFPRFTHKLFWPLMRIIKGEYNDGSDSSKHPPLPKVEYIHGKPGKIRGYITFDATMDCVKENNHCTPTINGGDGLILRNLHVLLLNIQVTKKTVNTKAFLAAVLGANTAKHFVTQVL